MTKIDPSYIYKHRNPLYFGVLQITCVHVHNDHKRSQHTCVKYLSFNCFGWCNDITMIGILKSTFAYADHQWWINTSSARLYCLSKDNVLLKLSYSSVRTNILTIYLDCRDQIEKNTLKLWYCRTEFCQLCLIRDTRTYCGRMCP